jgi:tetratricopeptide (TPR) repeat protein
MQRYFCCGQTINPQLHRCRFGFDSSQKRYLFLANLHAVVRPAVPFITVASEKCFSSVRPSISTDPNWQMARSGLLTGTARLEKAIAAYRSALEERTRERVPLQWAMTQVNLAEALTAFADKINDIKLAADAIAALNAALDIFRKANHAPYLEEAQRILARSKSVAARLSGDDHDNVFPSRPAAD